MHPSTALATVLVDELLRCGVTEFVLSPGSRSAPLSYAVQAAERAGRLRLHVRVDERSAGFLALGLAKVSRRPSALIVTSGTAAANLHPAVLEAHHGAVPMIVLTADRPAELRGTGANQTTHQPGLYGVAVRWEADLPPAEGRKGEQRGWRTSADRAWLAATASTGPWGIGEPGPVHLNVSFRDPLAPDPDDPEGRNWPEQLTGRPGGVPWTVGATSPARVGSFAGSAVSEAIARVREMESVAVREERTLLVLGDLPDPTMADTALRVAQERAWPVIAEPFGGGDRVDVVPHGPLLLDSGRWLEEHLPTRVLLVGRVTLSRSVARLLRHPDVRVEAISTSTSWVDPAHVISVVHPWSELLAEEAAADEEIRRTGGRSADPTEWSTAWQDAGHRLAAAVAPVITASWPSGLAIASVVAGALGPQDVLLVGSSNPSRDLDLAGGSSATVLGNRGVAGIDGTVSTAVGVALAAEEPHRWARGRVVALMGDLTFLHDANGLLIGPEEPTPQLTIVVVNDDGGGIFHTLEYGEPGRAEDFERVFGTPTGVDLAALCAAHGVEHLLVRTPAELEGALAAEPPGIRVVEIRVPRQSHRGLREQLSAVAQNTLSG